MPKDKNGIEYNEGDIVYLKLPNTPEMIITNIDENNRATVKWWDEETKEFKDELFHLDSFRKPSDGGLEPSLVKE